MNANIYGRNRTCDPVIPVQRSNQLSYRVQCRVLTQCKVCVLLIITYNSETSISWAVPSIIEQYVDANFVTNWSNVGP